MSAVLSDIQEEMDERVAKARALVEKDIHQAFSRRGDLHAVVLPYVTGSGKQVYQTLFEVATDLMTNGESRAAFMAVLGNSECPYVQALRESLEREYVDQHAEEVAVAWAEA